MIRSRRSLRCLLAILNSEPPAPPEAVPNLTRREVRSIAILWGIPLLPLVTFMIEWGAAWATLGHIPVPMVDDPKYISGLCSILHFFTLLSFVLTIPAEVVGAFAYLVAWGAKLRSFLVAFIGVGMSFGVFAVLDKFPYDALGWWFD
jgi:hypothetical protein